jgi:hypothetical protein
LGLRGDWAGAAEEWRRIGDPYERALELADSGLPEPTLEALAVLDDLGAVPAAHLVRPGCATSASRASPAGRGRSPGSTRLG